MCSIECYDVKKSADRIQKSDFLVITDIKLVQFSAFIISSTITYISALNLFIRMDVQYFEKEI